MSLSDFRFNVDVDVSISFDCTGEYDPFDENAFKRKWTLSGSVSPVADRPELDLKRRICSQRGFVQGFPFINHDIRGSGGSTSGTTKIGQYADNLTTQDTWLVNTEPVLSEFGNLNGEVPDEPVFLIVKMPEDQTKTEDDPIMLTPPIDGIKQVYPGDIVYTGGQFGFGRWYVQPKTRYPLPDRTFFWEPNVNPKVKTGGIVDNVLAKPGTIMLPTSTLELPEGEDPINGMTYFYQNFGIQFDGQRWRSLYFEPEIFQPKDENGEPIGPKKIRNLSVNYFSPLFFERDFEQIHRNKCIVLSFVPATEMIYNLEYEDGFEIPFKFSERNFGVQRGPIIYDFNDAYSVYEKKNQEWLLENKLLKGSFFLDGVGIYDNLHFDLDLIPVTGNPYTYKTTAIDFETGDTLTNTYNVTYTASATRQ